MTKAPWVGKGPPGVDRLGGGPTKRGSRRSALQTGCPMAAPSWMGGTLSRLYNWSPSKA